MFKSILLLCIFIPTLSLAQTDEQIREAQGEAQLDREEHQADTLSEKRHEIFFTPSIQFLNFPHPLEGALEVNFAEVWGLKFSKNFLPEMSFEDTKVKLDNYSLALRMYPQHSLWFVSLAYGKHEIKAHHQEVISSFDTLIDAQVKADYLMPSTGWKWVWDSGFSLGMEIGWIFPYNSSSNISTNQDNNPLVTSDPEYTRQKKDAEDTAKKYISQGIPMIGLLEIGWRF